MLRYSNLLSLIFFFLASTIQIGLSVFDKDFYYEKGFIWAIWLLLLAIYLKEDKE